MGGASVSKDPRIVADELFLPDCDWRGTVFQQLPKDLFTLISSYLKDIHKQVTGDPTRGCTNWKEWQNNGQGCIIGKLGGIQKNKWQWRLVSVDVESVTYCEPKPGAKLHRFNLRGGAVRMVDNKSRMHQTFSGMKIEGSHPQKKTIEEKCFIAILMPRDQKFVYMVDVAEAKMWMLLLNQREFPQRIPPRK